jgi:small subunit ribosomal protein S6
MRGPGERAGSRGGEAALRPYEIVIIFDAGLDEAVIRSHVDRVTEHGSVERWGKRSFAYELAHRHEGYYMLVEVSAEPEVVAEVDRMLALSDEVLRHKIIRQGGKREAKVAPLAPVPDVPAAG